MEQYLQSDGLRRIRWKAFKLHWLRMPRHRESTLKSVGISTRLHRLPEDALGFPIETGRSEDARGLLHRRRSTFVLEAPSLRLREHPFHRPSAGRLVHQRDLGGHVLERQRRQFSAQVVVLASPKQRVKSVISMVTLVVLQEVLLWDGGVDLQGTLEVLLWSEVAISSGT